MGNPAVETSAARGPTGQVVDAGPSIWVQELTWRAQSKLLSFQNAVTVKRKVSIPVINKWIYVLFHAGDPSNGVKPVLIDELQSSNKTEADPNGGAINKWYKLTEPGSGKTEKSEYSAQERYYYRKGKLKEAEVGVLYFFLSPFQLGSEAVEELRTSISKDTYQFAPAEDVQLTVPRRTWWRNDSDKEISLTATPVVIRKKTDTFDKVVQIPDIWAWELDIHDLGFIPARKKSTEHRTNTLKMEQRFIAAALKGYMLDQADGKITGAVDSSNQLVALTARQGWDIMPVSDFLLESVPNISFTVKSKRFNRPDSPEVTHKVIVQPDRWDKSISTDERHGDDQGRDEKLDNVAKKWLYFDETLDIWLKQHVALFVEELKQCIRSHRHRILDMEAGNLDRAEIDATAFIYASSHYALVTNHLAEYKAGQQAINLLLTGQGAYTPLPKKLFECKSTGEETGEPVFKQHWAKYKGKADTALNILKNCTPHLVTKGADGFALGIGGSKNLFAIVFQHAGPKGRWAPVVARTFGIDAEGKKLTLKNRAVHFQFENFDRFRKWAGTAEHLGTGLAELLEPVESCIKLIGVMVSLAAVIEEGGGGSKEKLAKEMLEMVSTVCEAAKGYREKAEGRLAKVAKELGAAEKEVQVGAKEAAKKEFSAISKAIPLIDVAVCVINTHQAWKAGKSASEEGNEYAATGHQIEAAGYAVTGLLGLAVLCGCPEVVVAAAIGKALTWIGTIICQACTRSAWEDFACNCFLGLRNEDYPRTGLMGMKKRYTKLPRIIADSAESDDDDKRKNQLARFRDSTRLQYLAARVLLSRFKVEVNPSGSIWVEPGILDRTAVFAVTWKFDCSKVPGREVNYEKWVAVTVLCRPSEGEAFVCKVERKLTGTEEFGLEEGEYCLLKTTPRLLNIIEGERLEDFSLFPSRRGQLAQTWLPFNLGIRLFLGGTGGAEENHWSALPANGPLEIEMIHADTKVSAGTYMPSQE